MRIVLVNKYFTFFFHSSFEAFPKSAVPTLVSLVFVHNTVACKSRRQENSIPFFYSRMLKKYMLEVILYKN